MKKELINPIFLKTKEVFKDMIPKVNKINRGQLELKENPIKTETLAVSIGITGDLKGFVYLGFDKDTALDILSSMSGMEFNQINEMVKSGIGEIGNILMGNIATRFSELDYQTDITPPTVIKGQIEISSDITQFLNIPLETNIGIVNIYVSVKENKEA